jgi:hypothetical protein
MTIFADISGALDGHLDTMTDLPDVAWENGDFQPIKDELYLRASVLPGDTVQGGLGDEGLDEHLGIYQVDIAAPAGAYKSAAYIMADKVADHFKRGSTVSYNGVNVRIRNVSRDVAGREDGWYIFPVSITYFSHTLPR